ncbi:receptor-type tyrosine-protein phosphatase F-like [Branchiostoma floridae x Branchiostoma belcheri]
MPDVIVRGLPFNKEEDSARVLTRFLAEELHLPAADAMPTDAVHRLSRPTTSRPNPPLLARFVNFQDRNKVLSAGRRLRGNSRCGHCATNTVCDAVTGICPAGCESPWTGDTCQQIRATVTQPPVSLTRSLNQRAEFTCAGRGEPMPTVTWRHDGAVVTAGIVTAPDSTQHSFTSTLSISSVQRRDNGQYTCRATNVLNTDTSQPAALTVIERPENIAVIVTSYTSTEIHARVTVGFTGNLAITAIQVRYKQTAESTWGSWTSVNFTGTQGSFDLTGLTPATDYMGEVLARNDEGWSETGQFAQRTKDAPPGPPSDLQAPLTSHHSISLTWQQPAVTNGVITNYYIQYGPTTVCSDAQLSHGLNTTDSTTSRTVPELIPYTTYSFRICGFTSAGPGDYSGCVTAKTTEFTPTEPTSVELTDVNPCNCETANQHRTIQLEARWRRPQHVYGELRGYNLKLQQQDSVIYDHNITQGLGNDQLTYVVSADDVAFFEPARRYSLKVSAYNGVYVGEVKSSAESQTSDGCPTAPLVSKIPQEGMCAVNWTEPSGDRGNITGYWVAISATRLGEDFATDTPAEPVITSNLSWAESLARLPAYSLVHVTVRAITCSEGEASEEINCTVTRREPPNAIPNVTVDQDLSETSSSFGLILPNISQRNGPISCYQVIIVPMRKDETLDELTVRVGQPQDILTDSAPEDGKTEPYIALAYSGSSYEERTVTIGTSESCTDPCCHVGAVEGAPEPGNRKLSPGSAYTATVRAYVDPGDPEDSRQRSASQVNTVFCCGHCNDTAVLLMQCTYL